MGPVRQVVNVPSSRGKGLLVAEPCPFLGLQGAQAKGRPCFFLCSEKDTK